MDEILRSTIRVTKCLLSYGVVQENVEKIILEAFVDEIERYPILYERNVYLDGNWRKDKNCVVCEIVVPELVSECAGCSRTVCRFCLKNKCCPSCDEFFDKKCAICNEIPSIPVIYYLESCHCKNLYCYTCLRDSLAPNGGEITLKSCPKCRLYFKLPDRNTSGTYIVPRYSEEYLDAKHGEIFCPRKCGEKMLRVKAQAHLQVCPKLNERFE